MLTEEGGLKAGVRLGRYELLAPAGKGGMAAVWRARLLGPRGFSKMVALKVMLPSLTGDPRFESMFVAEARAASNIRHRNVREILDLGMENGIFYIAMEWVDGETLAVLKTQHGGAVPIAIAARIVLDAARGLHEAHEARDEDGAPLGIVHRDVSPENILVARDGSAKIADFGVAKVDGEPLANADFVKGKVRYMAPEQVYCENVDRRTDVFSLAVVLYEATTGKHPFAAATDLATLANVAAPEEADAPSLHVADYPPALERVLMKALSKDPVARFETAAAFDAALDRAMPAASPAEVAAFVGSTSGARFAERDASLERARTAKRAPPASTEPRRVRATGGAVAIGLAVVACTSAIGALTMARGFHQRMELPTPAPKLTPSPQVIVLAPSAPPPLPQPDTVRLEASAPAPASQSSRRRAPSAAVSAKATDLSAATVTPHPTTASNDGVLGTRE
jgi:hypothetical protein